MPQHALFYPEWHISDPFFLAESLLYWERLACIVPFPDFKDFPHHADAEMRKVLAAAHEQFVSPVVPTDAQKKRVHDRLIAFAEKPAPEWCQPKNLKPEHSQVFSAYKFSGETVSMLRESGWTFPKKSKGKDLELQVISDSAANLMMSVLADECSSATMPAITDDPGSFKANCNLLLTELGASNGLTDRKKTPPNRGHLRQSDHSFLLAKIPHLGFSKGTLDATVFRRLLDARKHSELEERRKNFCLKVDEYIGLLQTAEDPERHVIGEHFQLELDLNLRNTKKELRRAGLEALCSKEGAVAIMSGVLAGTLNPGIGIAMTLTGGLLAYQKARREALDKHWSSWVFSATSRKFTIW